MSVTNPPTSRYLNTDIRADDDFAVAAKKFMMAIVAGSIPISTSGSFAIPPFNSQEFTYYGATNNIQTITYKQDGAVVAVQTFTYVGGGGSDDDNVLTITLA